MPTQLEQYQRQQLSDADQQLGEARHDASWNNIFHPQSAETLRSNMNVAATANNVMQMKLAQAAQTDAHAQEIYQNAARFNEWQQMAPLRDQHLQSQIEAEQARTARLTAQGIHENQKNTLLDTQAANLHGGIAALNEQYPDRSDPAYHAGVMKLANDNFHAAKNDPVTQTLLKETATAADDARYNSMFKQAHQEASVLGRKYGVDVQYGEDGFPSVERTRTYAEEKGLLPTAAGTTAKENKPNAKYLEQAMVVAAKQADKDNAYNAAKKQGKEIDLTEHDNKLAVEKAKLGALQTALGIAAPATTPNPSATPSPKTVRQNGVTYTLQEDGSYK